MNTVALTLVLLLGACADASNGAASLAGRPPFPAGPLLGVEHWRALFDQGADHANREGERLSRSSDSYDHYPLAYSLDEQASMFEATGDPAYARRGLQWAQNMMASAQPSYMLPTSTFEDQYRGWVSASNSGDETPLYESYAWRYITRMLRLVQPELATVPPDVRAAYTSVLAFAETDILDKWLARGADEYIYRGRTHMAAHWASIALDLSRVTADPTRRARSAEIARNIDDHLPNYPGGSLRGQLMPNPVEPEAYWWSDVWGDQELPGQDVGHGNGVISYVVEARDLDAGWSAQDMARFSRTLTRFLLVPDGRFPEYVDGTGRGNGWLADGWVKLGRYDPATQAALQNHPVQNQQYYAAMAVNATMLAARSR